MPVHLTCSTCSKPMTRPPSRVKRTDHPTCSLACKATLIGRLLDRTDQKPCEICGVMITFTPSTAKRHKTCSTACRSEWQRRQPKSRPVLDLVNTESDGAVRIPLTRKDGSVRTYAIVDASDAAFVNQWRWHLANGYAQRSFCQPRGVILTTRMHQDILGAELKDGLVGDHIDRNKLNNRRSNLRAIPKPGNAQNKSSADGSSSRYRGVTWKKNVGKWMAQIQVNGKGMNLGYFDDEEQAAAVAREARLRLMPFAHD